MLPVGRYEVQLPRNGIYTLELYPQNVVIARHYTVRSRLGFGVSGYPNIKAFTSYIGGARVRFEPDTSRLYVESASGSDDVRVTPTMLAAAR